MAISEEKAFADSLKDNVSMPPVCMYRFTYLDNEYCHALIELHYAG